jgi:hypothetical protein
MHKAEFQRRADNTMSMVVEVGGGRGGGGGGVKGLFKRATSQGERHRDFDAARAKALVQAQNFEDPV